jgi:hypothetical protein
LLPHHSHFSFIPNLLYHCRLYLENTTSRVQLQHAANPFDSSVTVIHATSLFSRTDFCSSLLLGMLITKHSPLASISHFLSYACGCKLSLFVCLHMLANLYISPFSMEKRTIMVVQRCYFLQVNRCLTHDNAD